MAASNYEVRGGGSFCTVATLKEAVGPHADYFVIENQKLAAGDQVLPGEGLLCGGEFMRVNSLNGAGLQVARGCVDTIPRAIKAGTPIWFFDGGLYGDQREYAVGEKIAVKLPTRTIGNGDLTLDAVPPNDLQFVGRFARPYPPGRVLINNARWTSDPTLNKGTGDTTLTWNSRNRIIQADQFIGHEEAPVAPEDGADHLLSVVVGTTVKDERTVTAGGSVYTRSELRTILGLATSDSPKKAEFVLRARRGTFLSREFYRIPFTFNPSET